MNCLIRCNLVIKRKLGEMKNAHVVVDENIKNVMAVTPIEDQRKLYCFGLKISGHSSFPRKRESLIESEKLKPDQYIK